MTTICLCTNESASFATSTISVSKLGSCWLASLSSFLEISENTHQSCNKHEEKILATEEDYELLRETQKDPSTVQKKHYILPASVTSELASLLQFRKAVYPEARDQAVWMLPAHSNQCLVVGFRYLLPRVATTFMSARATEEYSKNIKTVRVLHKSSTLLRITIGLGLLR